MTGSGADTLCTAGRGASREWSTGYVLTERTVGVGRVLTPRTNFREWLAMIVVVSRTINHVADSKKERGAPPSGWEVLLKEERTALSVGHSSPGEGLVTGKVGKWNWSDGVGGQLMLLQTHLC